MFGIKDWKKEIFTLPNLLSLFRLALIPVYVNIYLNAGEDLHRHFLAGAVLAVSCLTDLADGHIARRFHMVSALGKVLDPLADKLTQFTLTICLSIRYPVLRGMLALFFIKEVFQSLVGLIFLGLGKVLDGALMVGKLCTAILFVSLILLVLFPVLPEIWVRAIALIDSIFLILSFGGYFLAYFGKNRKVRDIPQN